jgi:hypothetical protein
VLILSFLNVSKYVKDKNKKQLEIDRINPIGMSRKGFFFRINLEKTEKYSSTDI